MPILRRVGGAEEDDRMANDIAANKLVMVLLAIFLPPVAVALVDGLGLMLVLSILLTLCFGLPGMIFALWRVLK
jgi:uncharacterized membrane protein YqaE (UPF0057 family)